MEFFPHRFSQHPYCDLSATYWKKQDGNPYEKDLTGLKAGLFYVLK